MLVRQAFLEARLRSSQNGKLGLFNWFQQARTRLEMQNVSGRVPDPR